MFNRNQKGFTVIEILIVIAIIGILAALVIPYWTNFKKIEKRTELRSDIWFYMTDELNTTEYPEEPKKINGKTVNVKYTHHETLTVIIKSENSTLELCVWVSDFSDTYNGRTIRSIKIEKDGKTDYFGDFSKMDTELIENYDQKIDEMLLLILPDMEKEVQKIRENDPNNEETQLKKLKEEERILKETYESEFNIQLIP